MSLQANKFLRTAVWACIISAVILITTACQNTQKPLVIWTSNAEFASYAELFNATHSDVQCIVTYKNDPYGSLPPAKDEQSPDIIVGACHKDDSLHQYALPLDYMFKEQQLDREIFYAPLLEMGYTHDHQYMLPASFNLPAVIFSEQNKDFIPDQYSLSLDQIRDAGAAFNELKNDVYTRMGFAPSWNADFMYTAAKLMGTSFCAHGDTVSWDQYALNRTVQYLRSWTEDCNSTTTAETDYQFKYLNLPSLKWITEGRTLFVYMPSDELFANASEKLNSIDFRWLQQDGVTPIEDTVSFISLYKDSKNKTGAETFILWFLNENNQKDMLDWVRKLNFVSSTFGINGGFSSLKTVNERVFPIFYPKLLGNLPQEQALAAPLALHEHWDSLKEQVIIPFLKDATDTTAEDSGASMNERISIWSRQYF